MGIDAAPLGFRSFELTVGQLADNKLMFEREL
jgi:hypothetical protein